MSTKTTADRVNTTMRPKAHRQAEMAVALQGGSICDFVSDAVTKQATPILKKHDLDPENLPAKK